MFYLVKRKEGLSSMTTFDEHDTELQGYMAEMDFTKQCVLQCSISHCRAQRFFIGQTSVT